MAPGRQKASLSLADSCCRTATSLKNSLCTLRDFVKELGRSNLDMMAMEKLQLEQLEACDDHVIQRSLSERDVRDKGAPTPSRPERAHTHTHENASNRGLSSHTQQWPELSDETTLTKVWQRRNKDFLLIRTIQCPGCRLRSVLLYLPARRGLQKLPALDKRIPSILKISGLGVLATAAAPISSDWRPAFHGHKPRRHSFVEDDSSHTTCTSIARP